MDVVKLCTTVRLRVGWSLQINVLFAFVPHDRPHFRYGVFASWQTFARRFHLLLLLPLLLLLLVSLLLLFFCFFYRYCYYCHNCYNCFCCSVVVCVYRDGVFVIPLQVLSYNGERFVGQAEITSKLEKIMVQHGEWSLSFQIQCVDCQALGEVMNHELLLNLTFFHSNHIYVIVSIA